MYVNENLEITTKGIRYGLSKKNNTTNTIDVVQLQLIYERVLRENKTLSSTNILLYLENEKLRKNFQEKFGEQSNQQSNQQSGQQ